MMNHFPVFVHDEHLTLFFYLFANYMCVFPLIIVQLEAEAARLRVVFKVLW